MVGFPGKKIGNERQIEVQCKQDEEDPEGDPETLVTQEFKFLATFFLGLFAH
jgi:hypothetical protein